MERQHVLFAASGVTLTAGVALLLLGLAWTSRRCTTFHGTLGACQVQSPIWAFYGGDVLLVLSVVLALLGAVWRRIHPLPVP